MYMPNGSCRRVFRSAAAALLLTFCLLAPDRSPAQVTGGMLIGTVGEQSGAFIARSHVTAEDVATGVKRTTITNEAGAYAIPNLLPGVYRVTASADGFGLGVKSGVTIAVGTQQALDFVLGVASTKDEVSVTAQPEALQLTTSELSGAANGVTLRETPLNGRSWSDLALLQPGVAPVQTQRSFETGGDRGTRGFGAQIIISGGRPQQNNYRINGVSVNDYANGAGSVSGGNLGADAMAEFSVLTSNAPAAYGKNSGGVINAITQSGTNSFHGDAYEFLRNSALDARNFFDGSVAPPFRRNQFGAALGGPVKTDRTFFFVNYEAIRQSKGVTSVSTVPTSDARNGIIRDQSGAVTNVAVDPGAAKYLTFWPLPNAGLTPNGFGNTGFFNFAARQVLNEDFGLARIDHEFSDRDSLFGSYLYDRTPYTYPDNLNDLLFVSTTARQIAAIEESHTFAPNLVNSFHLGLNRSVVDNNVPSEAINPATSDPSLGTVPGASAAGVIVTGLATFAGGFGASGTTYSWTSSQLSDDLFWSKGRHSVKVGVAAENMRLNVFTRSNPNGQFSFGSLTNFLTNHPSKFNAAIPTAISPRALRQTLFGGYFQDDWRVSPAFTVNLGLRYEMSTALAETQGKLSNLLSLTDAQPHLGSPFYTNPTRLNFEPRAGFAWDPFRDGKSAVRGAFGIYDVLPLPYEFILPTTSATPFTVLGTVSGSKLPAGSFYTGASSLLGPASLRATYLEHDPKRNYVMQWNVNLQREIANDFTGVVAYVGSRGVHQPYYSNQFDIVAPAKTSEGYFWPSPIGSGSLVNPNFGSIRGMLWEANSVYHSLQLGLRKRLSHGLQLQASYTWSKSIDDTSSSFAPDGFANSISTLPYFDLKRGRGLSDFNMSRILVLNGTWSLPMPKSPFAAVNWLAGGWQIGGVFRASEGQPFTATFGTDGDPLGAGLTDYPNRLTGPGCSTLTNPGQPRNFIKTECFAIPTASAALLPKCDPKFGTGSQCFNLLGNAGRNILTGPGLANLDLALFKNVRIPWAQDRGGIQFRTEIFNALNRTNFATPPSTDIFDSTGKLNGAAGLLTSTSTTSREIQFGVKIRW